jgi:hypothetical protein
MLNYPISRKPVTLARVACLENEEPETDKQTDTNTGPVAEIMPVQPLIEDGEDAL